MLSDAWGFDVELERPPDPKLGDYAFPCFSLAKEMKRSPAEIAKELASKVPELEYVERVDIAGPYVNFYVKDFAWFDKVLSTIDGEKADFGFSMQKRDETVCIDFSSPNIAKPFHYGHLRATVIGNALYLLLKSQGYNVVRINYIGDWGTQFGAVLAAWNRWGEEKELEKDPITYLVELYQKFHEKELKEPGLHEEAKGWFQKLEKNDPEALALWEKFKDASLEDFKRIYDLLGVEFDDWNGESYFRDRAREVIELAKPVAERDEGALIVRVPGVEAPLLLEKTDGTSTYASRDLAAIKYRIEEYDADRILYVVGAEQGMHFKQVFWTASRLGLEAGLEHVPFGLYLSPGGGKLSTRRGTVVMLTNVLDDVVQLAREMVEEKNPHVEDKDFVARTVAVSAILFGDLVNDRAKDVVFDKHKILEFEGDTGPYLQYTHARANSILRKSELAAEIIPEVLVQKQELALVKTLGLLPAKVEDAAATLKPHVIAQYLLEVGRRFNEFYQSCPVLQSDERVQKARLMLVQSTVQVLANGMRLLGMAPLDEM